MQKEMGPPKILDELACAPFWRNICHRMEKDKRAKNAINYSQDVILDSSPWRVGDVTINEWSMTTTRNKKWMVPLGWARSRRPRQWAKLITSVCCYKWKCPKNAIYGENLQMGWKKKIWRIISRQAVKNLSVYSLSRVYEQSNMVTTNAHTHFHCSDDGVH